MKIYGVKYHNTLIIYSHISFLALEYVCHGVFLSLTEQSHPILPPTTIYTLSCRLILGGFFICKKVITTSEDFLLL
jgi:hypothetical protein